MASRTPRDDFVGAMRPIPRLTLRAEEAAIAIGISESMLHLLVSEGNLPKPFCPPGHPGVMLYDVEDLKAAVRVWKDGPELVNLADRVR